jgi:hypothetical protein
MKKHLFLWLFLLPFGIQAQSICKLLEPSREPISWLGVDFSHIYFPPSFTAQMKQENLTKDTLQTYLFASVNRIICKEYKKYDPGAMFRTSAYLDTAGINQINREIEIDLLFENPGDTLSVEDIYEITEQYTLSKNSGFAVALIAERFEIKKKRMIFHLIAIDASTRELVLDERILIRINATKIRQTTWNSIFQLMRLVEEKKYREWKKRLCS